MRISKELQICLLILGLVISVYLILPIINLNNILNIINCSVKNYNSFVNMVENILFSCIKLLILVIIIGFISEKKLYHLILNNKTTNQVLQLMIIIFSFSYLIIGYYLAVRNFDLGYDEVWYLSIAKKFYSGIISIISMKRFHSMPYTSMLPNHIIAFINYSTGWTNVWQFKAINSIFNLIFIGLLAFIYYKVSGKNTSILSILILIFLPGFLFVSSSFFCIISAAALMIAGGYIFFKGKNWHSLIFSGLLMAIAMHTKLQLIPLLFLILIIYYLLDKNKRLFKLIITIIILYAMILSLRYLPNLFINSDNPLRTFTKLGSYFTESRGRFYIADHIQLYNNFIPIIIFISVSFMYLRRNRQGFDLFIYICSSVINIWWMVFYNMATYRHLYLGLIPFAYVSSKVVIEYISEYIQTKKQQGLLFLNVTLIVMLLLILNGAYTNLKDAYIGYNDGVQFHYSGVDSRLFKPILTDTNQKDFYKFASTIIREDDIIYNGNPFFTEFYLGIPGKAYNEIEPVMNIHQWLILSRENYPLGLEKAHKMMKGLPGQKSLIYKSDGYELYKLNFEGNSG